MLVSNVLLATVLRACEWGRARVLNSVAISSTNHIIAKYMIGFNTFGFVSINIAFKPVHSPSPDEPLTSLDRQSLNRPHQGCTPDVQC